MELRAPVITELYPDCSDKNIIAVHYQDCEPILEDNKIVRDNPDKGEWGRKIASVPNNLIHQWLIEEWVKGNKDLRPFTREFNMTVVLPKLRDPAYKYLLV